jgi:hypothetical protein
LVRDDVSCPKAPSHSHQPSGGANEERTSGRFQRCCLQRSSWTLHSLHLCHVYIYMLNRPARQNADLIWLYTAQYELLSFTPDGRASALRRVNSHLAASNSMQTAHALIPGKLIPSHINQSLSTPSHAHYAQKRHLHLQLQLHSHPI